MSTLLTTLTSSVALILNVLLIVLLVARELLRGAQSPAMQRLRRLFGVACLPLLAVFIATVVIRLSTIADPTAAAQGSSPAVAAVAATPAVTASPIASSSATPPPVASPTATVMPTRSPAATVTAVPPTAIAAATTTPLSTPPVAPTVVPTASPSVSASASPAPTPTSVVVASQLDVPLSAWPTRDGTTAQMGYADEQYQLVLSGQPNVGIASVLPADSYRTSIDVTLGQGEAGVVFLATEPATFYRVMINTDGAYAIQSLRNDQVRNIVAWTDSPALNGTTTRLRIERQGTTVQFSANDQPLTTFTVPDGPGSNQIGVALASDTDQGQATFSNLVVEKLSVAQ